MKPAVSISTPDGLLSVIPVVLGFHPTDSVVLACMKRGTNQIGPIARFELSDYLATPIDLAEQMAFSLVKHADQCVLIFYGADADPAGFAGLLAAYGMKVIDTVFTSNEPHKVHPGLHAESIGMGKVIADSREDLRALVEFNDCPGALPDMTILASMFDAFLRDAYLAANVANAKEVLPHVLETCRRVDDPLPTASPARAGVVANLCAAAAVLAYRTGDGTLAQVCLDRCFRVNGEHRLGHLLMTLMSIAIQPEELDALVQGPPSDAKHYLFREKWYEPAALVEVLIAEGVASPAARDMDTDELIESIVNQGFLNEREAPLHLR
jgi:hypothetical protein